MVSFVFKNRLNLSLRDAGVLVHSIIACEACGKLSEGACSESYIGLYFSLCISMGIVA